MQPSCSLTDNRSLDSFDWSRTPLGPWEQWTDQLRKAVEDALQTGDPAEAPTPAAALDALFSAAPLGLAIWDRDFRFVRVNDSLAAINGISPAEHVGRTPAELLPDIAGLDRLFDGWREIVRSGKPWLDVEVVGGTPAAPGEKRCWTEHFFPIRSSTGVIQGIGAVVEETTERRRVEAALRVSDARFREFAEASSDILWLRNTETAEFEFLSEPLRQLYGVAEHVPDGDGQSFRWIEAIVPEDRESAIAAIAEVRKGHRVTHDFRTYVPGTGQVRWLKNTAFPLPDPDGQVRRVGGIAQDVTEERETAQRLQTLIAELQHRTRNLMGVVQAIAERTLQASTDLAQFGASFCARIAALSRVQGLLSRLEGLERIGFDELLRSELDAFGALPEDDLRVSIGGPARIPLASSGLQMLALALHELITNASKYGALSQPHAKLTITWALLPPSGDGRVSIRIEWVESGVELPAEESASRRRGQGRELIEQALPYQLNARVQYELGADGVRCAIELPTSQTLSQVHSL